jgi:hypothetical protein
MARQSRDGRGRWIAALALGALALGGGLAGGARAAEVTDQQAATLETQLRAWLASVFGPHLPLGERPIHLAARGDHFALEVPISGPVGGTMAIVQGGPVTASLLPLEGGRWGVEKLSFPSPLRIAVAGGIDGVWTATVQEQEQHGVVDPSFATTSVWDGTLHGYQSLWRGAEGEHKTDAANVVAHGAWQPVTGGRVDFSHESTSDLITMTSTNRTNVVASFSAARMHLTARADGLAPDRLPPIAQAAVLVASQSLAALAELEAGAPEHSEAAWEAKAEALLMEPQTHAALEAALEAFGELLGGASEAATLENVHVHAVPEGGPPVDAAFRKLAIGLGLSAPAGRLRLQTHFAFDSFESASLPPGKLREYLPRHIAFSPRIGGLPAQAVMSLLRVALKSNGQDPQLEEQANALLENGPLAVGMDDFTADFGPATLAAGGEMRVTGPSRVAGEAHIAVRGLDRLLRDVTADPDLQQAAPVLIFLKGIGQQDGPETVWNLAYSDGHLIVNGTDMTQMMGGK